MYQTFHVRRITLLFPLLVGAVNLRAQGEPQQDEIAQLKAVVQAQQALNQKLLERVEALEVKQGALLERIKSVEESVPEDAESGEQRGGALESLRRDYADLQEKLDELPALNGYFDFEYLNDDRKNSPSEFRQRHLTLLVTKEYKSFRLFGEVEFEWGPVFEGEGGKELEEAAGEVKLEQAWAEWVHSDRLTLRVGKMYTPGYANVHQWPNLRHSSANPLLQKEGVFPETFVGVKAYGTRYWNQLGLTYQAYVANGVSEFSAKEDINENKAVGGQLTFHLPTGGLLDTWDVGLSGYMESPPDAERTRTWGVETQVRKGPWEVLAEFAMRKAEEDRSGFYLQPSYRINEQWTTFYRYDLLNTFRHDMFDIARKGEHQEHRLGVNYHPITNISLKLEYIYGRAPEDGNYNGAAASVAIKF